MELSNEEITLIKTLRQATIADPTEKFITVHLTPFLSHGEYHHVLRVLPQKIVPKLNAPLGLQTMFDEMKKGLGLSQSLWLVFYDHGVLQLFKTDHH